MDRVQGAERQRIDQRGGVEKLVVQPDEGKVGDHLPCEADLGRAVLACGAHHLHSRERARSAVRPARELIDESVTLGLPDDKLYERRGIQVNGQSVL